MFRIQRFALAEGNALASSSPIRYTYWPPSSASKNMTLPGGRKKFFVFNGRNDRDGSATPVLCICTRGNDRLAFFDKEELDELTRVVDRLHEYMILWEKKALKNREYAENQEFNRHSSAASIGVDL